MKNFHEFFNKEKLPWVNLIWETYYQNGSPTGKLKGSPWWRAHLKLLNTYKQQATCSIVYGKSTLFLDQTTLEQKYPELFSAMQSTAKFQPAASFT
jgi:hypothetical protein